MPNISRTLSRGTVVLTALVSVSCSIFSLDVENTAQVLSRSFVSDGRSRSYLVHLPLDFEGRLPVVIVFHGSGGSGQGIKALTEFEQLADQSGFYVAYPDAISDWAEGCDCSQADLAGIDDVQFTSDLIDALDAELGIDRSRVFVAGFSQGGLMVFRLACDLADEVAGIATVGASMAVPLSENCAPTEADPIIVMLGTDDEFFPWDGAYDLGLQSVLSADSTAADWAAANGCTGERGAVLEYTGQTSGVEVWHEEYAACAVGSEVTFYRLEGAGHIWPEGGFSASWSIADFFGLQ